MRGTANRQPASGRLSGVTWRCARISCISTASVTSRVIAHTVSSVVDSGTVPSSGVRRCVFLKPTKPCNAAGMRIDPPVSEPSAASAAPLATDTAPPEVDPPGARSLPSSAWVIGFAGVPKCGLMPTPENANSLMLVWPTSTPPAWRTRATAGLSAAQMGASCIVEEAAVVGNPATSYRSFTETGAPAKAPMAAPARCIACSAAALARADVSNMRMNALVQASDAATSSAWRVEVSMAPPERTASRWVARVEPGAAATMLGFN